MKRLTKRYASHVAVICHNCEKEHTPCDIPDCRDVVLNRLAEYEDMEEQGLLLKLPCKMGDKLWIIVTKRPRVYSPEFSFVKASKLTWNNLQQVLKGLKKTVFTSREAAEKALEGNNESTV